MNKKQYNHIINYILTHDQTGDSFSTARAVFKNLGVALPNGDGQIVCEILKTNDYMGWRSCTMQEAQAAADRGTVAIGVCNDRMVILAGADDEEPVAASQAVMTVSETTPVLAVADLAFYVYECGTTTCPTVSVATNIYRGVPVEGVVCQGKENWYNFIATENIKYTFMTTGYTDTYGELYENGKLLQSNDTSTSNNFCISRTLSKGSSYSLKVRGTDSSVYGAYTLIVKGGPLTTEPLIFTRGDWGARSPDTSTMTVRGRAKRIIYHHSADKFDSTNISDVIAEIKNIQNKHMSDPDIESDIAYHYVIDPAGRIWEARSLYYKGAHAYGYNNDIGVVLLGDFEPRALNLWNPNVLNQKQKDAMERLAKWLCFEHDLDRVVSGVDRSPVSTHRTVNETDCPGDNAAPWIENDLSLNILNWGK